ncbi:MAG: hypothetical protein QOK16_4546 [Solirubrobacteraceae bacterium]|jgi:uncharacterized protein involved in propanediol utilization|nr:hypothetical protein [Solirubrobacteraceae bacterium]
MMLPPVLIADREVRTATACSPGHHGEILQGAFYVGSSIQRALVTMPCPGLWSQVTVAFRRDLGCDVQVRPSWKTKVRRAVELALHAIGEEGFGASVAVHSNIAPARGYGSSTSDVTAAIKAVLKAFDRSLSIDRMAQLAVAAEGASDGTLWNRPVLFAHREGRLVEDYGQALPRMRVLAFQTAPDGNGVDTLALSPARYDAYELAELEMLRCLLRVALQRGDVGTIGAVATMSAWINQRHLPVPAFAELEALSRDCHAAGVQVAHSGDVASFLFEPDPLLDRWIAQAHEELAARGLGPWQFAVGGDA